MGKVLQWKPSLLPLHAMVASLLICLLSEQLSSLPPQTVGAIITAANVPLFLILVIAVKVAEIPFSFLKTVLFC